MLLLIFVMFERWTKKATDTAVENVKKTFDERVNDYGDIIKIGLVMAVVILGGKHFTGRNKKGHIDQLYLPNGQQPIVINNYYTRERDREREEYRYGRREEKETYRSRGASHPKR